MNQQMFINICKYLRVSTILKTKNMILNIYFQKGKICWSIHSKTEAQIITIDHINLLIYIIIFNLYYKSMYHTT